MDVLRGVPLLVHKQRVLIDHLVVVLLLSDLHLDICRYKVVCIFLATVTLGRRGVRVEGILPVIIVSCTDSLTLIVIVTVLDLLLKALYQKGNDYECNQNIIIKEFLPMGNIFIIICNNSTYSKHL